METSSSIIQAQKSPIDFAWLEITPTCQLRCVHCYRDSMPGLGHGTLHLDDWKRILSSLHSIGTRFVQFIGGEPTIHPQFCELVEFAAETGLHIEIYTNLVSITAHMWDIFSQYHVRLATSFYAPTSDIHDAITLLPGSHRKTTANIAKAVALGLRLRVGIVKMRDDQNIEKAKSLLTDLGVLKSHIGVDRVRGVGRGANAIIENPVSALCGKCVTRRCVITSDGDVFPCVFSRSFNVGNVLNRDIADIVRGPQMQQTITKLSDAFVARQTSTRCDPLDCDPECDPLAYPPCKPDCCPETVASCEPSEDDDDSDDDE